MADAQDWYAILEVAPDASAAELKSAYRRLARAWHPDRNPAPGAEARFRRIASAWEVLGDPVRRAAYDREQGRVQQGLLPEDFVADVGSAMERAERWVRDGVLPHYARYWRGDGAEVAVRLLADADALRVPRALPAASWWRRRALRRRLGSVAVTALLEPTTQLSAIRRGRRHHEIIVLPAGLWAAGARDPVVLDDALVQILLSRFALVLGAWRAPPPQPDDGFEHALAWAVAHDTAVVRRRRATALGWGTLLLVLAVLLAAGYAGW